MKKLTHLTKTILTLTPIILTAGWRLITNNNQSAHSEPALICPDAIKNDEFGCDEDRLKANLAVMNHHMPTAEQMINYLTPLYEEIKNTFTRANPNLIWYALNQGDNTIEKHPTIERWGGSIDHHRFGDDYVGSDVEQTTYPCWRTSSEITDDQFQNIMKHINNLVSHYGFPLNQTFVRLNPDDPQGNAPIIVYLLEYKIANVALTVIRSIIGEDSTRWITLNLEINGFLPEKYWTIPPPAAPTPGHWPPHH